MNRYDNKYARFRRKKIQSKTELNRSKTETVIEMAATVLIDLPFGAIIS